MKDATTSPQLQRQMHGALILAQIFFGGGAIVGSVGLTAMHPLVFALAREFWAGIILLAIAMYLQYDDTEKYQSNVQNKPHVLPSPSSTHTPLHPVLAWTVHWRTFTLLGMLVFGNQAGFIVGIKMAGPVTASVWQPSQPIIAAAICMAWGWEPLQFKRLAGIFVAFSGCLAMILWKTDTLETLDDGGTDLTTDVANDDKDGLQSELSRYVVGNALLFLNCLCTALYVILSKRVLTLYPALLVTAWSYNFATLWMGAATLLATAVPGSQEFFCPECPLDASPWHFETASLPALWYYIAFASVGSYGLLTWANQYATGTLVMSYTVLQPAVAALFTTALLATHVISNCQDRLTLNEIDRPTACLEYPSVGTFCGMGGVIFGLFLIVASEKTALPRKERNTTKEMETVPLTSMVDELMNE